jgi:cytoskeleton protein RodZ
MSRVGDGDGHAAAGAQRMVDMAHPQVRSGTAEDTMNDVSMIPGANAAPDEATVLGAQQAAERTRAEIGGRLRAAREACGLAIDEFARKARVPGGVLADLESGRFDRLGATIYVRGYLRSAARAAGIDERELLDLVEPVAVEVPLPPPALQPRSRPLWIARYATPVAYALLTAVVMVPLVYLARPGSDGPASPTLTTIESAPVGSASSLAVEREQPAAPAPSAPATSTVPLVVTGPAPAGLPQSVVEHVMPPPSSEPSRPVMASLAALPERSAPGSVQKVVLELSDPSWVEFTGSDGSRLEYALLPAGTRREYQLAGAAELRIGNTRGATLSVDGRPVDLQAQSRANVATVRLGSGGTPPSN